MHPTPRPVVSGKAYPVLRAGDNTPAVLADFVGTAEFVIDLRPPEPGPDLPGPHRDEPELAAFGLLRRAPDEYTVHGVGLAYSGSVRFHEKDSYGAGKDVRVWCVREQGPGYFTAEHVAIS